MCGASRWGTHHSGRRGGQTGGHPRTVGAGSDSGSELAPSRGHTGGVPFVQPDSGSAARVVGVLCWPHWGGIPEHSRGVASPPVFESDDGLGDAGGRSRATAGASSSTGVVSAGPDGSTRAGGPSFVASCSESSPHPTAPTAMPAAHAAASISNQARLLFMNSPLRGCAREPARAVRTTYR